MVWPTEELIFLDIFLLTYAEQLSWQENILESMFALRVAMYTSDRDD